MSDTSRCFLAIDIPEEIKKKILALQKELAINGIKLVESENIHITLKFLGNVTAEEGEKTKQLLKQIPFHCFQIRLKDIGVFPNENSVHVIWVDCKSKELQQLGEKINKLLVPLFKEEEFTPHLTIARVKQKCDLKDFLEKHKHDDFGSFSCTGFVLYKSELTKQGPIYTRVATFASKQQTI